MPMLQIDGVSIAEIDQDKADKLLELARFKIGKVRPPATFQPQITVAPRRRFSPPESVRLTIVFARAAGGAAP